MEAAKKMERKEDWFDKLVDVMANVVKLLK